MTAVNIVVQPDRVHFATDAATYMPDGTITELASKVITVQRWPGMISGRGVAVGVPRIGSHLLDEFDTFDDLVAGVEDEIESIVESSGIAGRPFELFIAGWSDERECAEAYTILTTDDLPRNCSQDEATASRLAGFMPDEPFRLLRLPNVVFGPAPLDETATEAMYEGINPDGSPNDVVKSLRKVLEMQRHDKRDDGIHWCGGFGELTTITAHGVHQEILQRWPDKVGERLKTLPIDWLAWCHANAMPPSTEVVAMRDQIRELNKKLAIQAAPLSRLQRERMKKKARKGKLRAA